MSNAKGGENFTFGALNLIYPTFSHLSCSDAPFWSTTFPLAMKYLYDSKTEIEGEKRKKEKFSLL